MQGMSTSTPKDHLEQHDDLSLSRKDADVALLLFSTRVERKTYYLLRMKTQDVKTTRQRQTQATWCTQVITRPL